MVAINLARWISSDFETKVTEWVHQFIPEYTLPIKVVVEHHDSVNASIEQFETFRVRKSDGYICATDICKSAGKIWSGYWRNQTTQTFITRLSESNGISAEALIESTHGGGHTGTWVCFICLCFQLHYLQSNSWNLYKIKLTFIIFL